MYHVIGLPVNVIEVRSAKSGTGLLNEFVVASFSGDKYLSVKGFNCSTDLFPLYEMYFRSFAIVAIHNFLFFVDLYQSC